MGQVRAAGHARDVAVQDHPAPPRRFVRRTRPEHVRRHQRARLALGRRGRDAVPRGTQVRRPAAVPRSGHGDGDPVGRPHRPAHLRRAVVRRLGAGGDAAGGVPPGARPVPVDGVRTADRVRVRVLPAGRRPASRCSTGTTSSTPSGTRGCRRSGGSSSSCPRPASTSSRRTASTPAGSGRSTSGRGWGWPVRTTRSRSRTA